MIVSGQGRGTGGCLVGLLLFVAACTLSTEDIHLTGVPSDEESTDEELPAGSGDDEGGGGDTGGPENRADAGSLGGSGGSPLATGGNGGTTGVPGSGGAAQLGGLAGGGSVGGAVAGSSPGLPQPLPMTGGVSGSGGSAMGGSYPPSGGGTNGIEVPSAPRAKSFDFETGTQGWQDIKGAGAQVTRTTERAWSGSASLEISFATKKSDVEKARYIGVLQDQTPVLRPGQTIRFHFFIPAGKDSSALFALQPFAITKAGLWQGNFKLADLLARNTWIDFDLTLPNNYDTQDLLQFGVQAVTREDGTRVTFYVDGVTF
ncbi:MAG: hypothetical protein SF187_30240 [Deltaproteobacteria bacterium]|nr:hypothetical protein [Deltaproteobacteria bacterium]